MQIYNYAGVKIRVELFWFYGFHAVEIWNGDEWVEWPYCYTTLYALRKAMRKHARDIAWGRI